MQGELLSARYRGRRAAAIENRDVRVTVLAEGGHVAELYDKGACVNPLWTPPWPTLEPSAFERGHTDLYGEGSDARLLAGIMGHSLCLDIFGPPSTEEAQRGLTAHGEASVVPYSLQTTADTLTARADFPIAGLGFERRITLRERTVQFRERLVNRCGRDRDVGWTQHVTLGPPFLERGSTEFRASAGRSKVFETEFGADDYLRPGAEFNWPMAPTVGGGHADLRLFGTSARSSAYTAHLMNGRPAAFFVAFSPRYQLAIAYVWNSGDFPWMGIWEENRSRTGSPWNGRTLTRGMEFGVSPMPETREAMRRRGTLFGVPAYRRIAAGETIDIEYQAIVQRASSIPESFEI